MCSYDSEQDNKKKYQTRRLKSPDFIIRTFLLIGGLK